MVKELTPYEYRKLAQFLKRWGIDHPELLAEMTDHYGEKALDEIEKGSTLDSVLESWKTKSTFLTLRKIQREYEDLYPKRWNKTQWAVAKSIIFSRNLLWLMALLIVLCGLYLYPITRRVFEYIMALKLAANFGIVLYFLIRKRYRNIISFRNFSFYYIFYANLFQVVFRMIWPSGPDLTNNNILVPLLLGISLFVDFIYFRLWKMTLEDTVHISAEMLEEHVPAKYNPGKY